MSVEGPFRWGVATSAYQIEGAHDADGKGESIWDRFAHTPGRIAGGDTGDVACDHYHRWREDVSIMRAMGVDAYRFSVAWTRIQPDGAGSAEPRGLAFYDALVDGLLDAGIEPWVTLYHWDLPQALEDAGGWPRRETAERFAEYAAIVGRALGDRVRHWVTVNEPWEIAVRGYLEGSFAPGRRDLADSLRAAHTVLLAHGLGMQALRAVAASASVGIALSVVHCHPLDGSPDARAAARAADGRFNRWYLDPLFGRGYPADVVASFGDAAPPTTVRDLAAIATPLDFLGLNYYYSAWVGPRRPIAAAAHGAAREPADPGAAPYTLADPPASVARTGLGWAVDPAGLRLTLERIDRDYSPATVVITESGAAYDDVVDAASDEVADVDRVRYHEAYIAACLEAAAEGIPVKGYFAWSLLDNLEWDRGFAPRFGLVHVDRASLRRTPKASARWYADLMRRRRASGDGGATAGSPAFDAAALNSDNGSRD